MIIIYFCGLVLVYECIAYVEKYNHRFPQIIRRWYSVITHAVTPRSLFKKDQHFPYNLYIKYRILSLNDRLGCDSIIYMLIISDLQTYCVLFRSWFVGEKRRIIVYDTVGFLMFNRSLAGNL